MGTRADFYIGRDPNAMRWIGSIAWDGFPPNKRGGGIAPAIIKADSEEAFEENVIQHLGERKDFTHPAMGWPWPWDNSGTTDWAYAFDPNDGKVYLSCFGRRWLEAGYEEGIPESYENEDQSVSFPDMKSKQKVTLGKRSGVIVFGAAPQEPAEPKN